ncbi:MAG: DUF3887 domain-containing protein, partial [Coriobacteriia bacterium]|nr:DUF3887 domain-containing protein [Coriobacteriia bacterium]
MKPIRGFLAFIVALSLLTSCQTTSNEPGTSQIDWSDREHRAAQFVLALVEGDYSIAAEAFSSDMQRQLGVKGLKSAWDSVIQQAGAFEAIVSEDTLPHDEYDIREVTSDHATRGVVTRIVFSDDDKVAGLFFSYTDKSEGRDMSPADRGAYTDYPVTVGEGTGFPLAGVLSVPKSPQAKLPAVVLVHGSGPQDMDETAYGITVFKDIAEYLAANGVVV